MRSLRLVTLLISFHFSIANVYSGEIRVGMSTALSGPLQEVGQDMRTGVETYFAKVNQLGGVNGHTLKLIVRDDAYEPMRAARNMRHLIDNERVLAVIGNVGTPTAIVTVPIANEKRTLLFGSFTGADVLRKIPHDRYILNYRASYSEEIAVMVDGLLQAGINPEEIAFFTQRDGYGDAGYKSAVEVLKKHNFTNTDDLTHGRYTRNTLNVEAAVAKLIDAKVTPRAVIMAGSYEPSAKFIKLAKEEIPDLIFLNLSFVGAHALGNALGEDAEGVIVTQVVPHYESDIPVANEYRQNMSEYMSAKQVGFVSFEGYIVAKLFVESLKGVEGEISKEGLIDSFQIMTGKDIGLGIDISFTDDDGQAIHNVWPMVCQGGTFKEINWNRLIK